MTVARRGGKPVNGRRCYVVYRPAGTVLRELSKHGVKGDAYKPKSQSEKAALCFFASSEGEITPSHVQFRNPVWRVTLSWDVSRNLLTATEWEELAAEALEWRAIMMGVAPA